jgi:hypothetical protein
VVGVDQVGQLPDVVDALFVSEPALFRALDGSDRRALPLVERAVVEVPLLRELESCEEPQAIFDDEAS